MTSTASQQNNPAPNPSAQVTSYASAAGANKKPASTPVIAAGSQQPPVVVGSSQPAQHGRPSASPVNGRPAITPAVPTVAAAPAVVHGSSNMNGNAVDHSRKPSVTMSGNGPNSFIANGGSGSGPKGNMPQFGFAGDSPAVSHSTPHQTAAPIAIPGNARIPSPAHSPSPIPQPSASGGRPPSIPQDGPAMKFGSLGGDGEVSCNFPWFASEPLNPSPFRPAPHFGSPKTCAKPLRALQQNYLRPSTDTFGQQRHMKHAPSMSQNSFVPNQPHMRRESNHSIHGEMGHAGPGSNRGGYGGGRGRGGFNSNPSFAGYPPNGGYNRGPAGQGRGMPPQFQPGARPYPNSPQPNRASPAMPHAVPNPTTPHMHYNMPNPANQFQFTPPGPQYNPVNTSLPSNVQSFKHNKKKGPRRDVEKQSRHPRHSDSLQNQPDTLSNGRPRRYSSRWETNEELKSATGDAPLPSEPPGGFVPPSQPIIQISQFSKPLDDLSPASGNFDRLLTARKQNYPYGGYQQPGQPMMNYNAGYPGQMSYMTNPAQSPSPGYVGPYTGPQQFTPQPPAAQQMSRNSSQVSERPNSSTGQPPVPMSGPAQFQGKASPAPATSAFERPKKKSAAIQIKAPSGAVFDPNSLKAPSSPAPVVQPAKTPPVVASAPTPPPKPATPAHTRTESSSTKTAEQLRMEFKEQVRKQAGGDTKVSEDESAKPAAEEIKQDVEVKEAKTEEPAQVPEKVEAKPAEEKKVEAKPTEEVEETEDERFEREIREMEEAEAAREKAEAEYNAKKAAKAEEAKKDEEKNRAANAAENDRKLREQEREMERLEEERERQRKENEAKAAGGGKVMSVADALREKISDITADKKEAAPSADAVADKLADLKIAGDSAAKPAGTEKQRAKPAALNLKPINTSTVEPPQPSAALQSLKTARFLDHKEYLNMAYPAGIQSPNPALNSAVTKKGKAFKYDAGFLLQFQKVFTEQPSLDFVQQVKTLIGDDQRSASVRTPAGSGRQNSRGGVSGFPGGIGNFQQPPKPVGPGTTSEQRFAKSNAVLGQGPPGMAFGRPFPGGNSMSGRTPSSNMGNIPNSPRTGSRRPGSKRDNFNAKAEAQAAKTMPLTQGMEIKPIAVSATGWKPTSIANKAPQSASGATLLDPAMVQRKVKAALNKMTPEKFDKISDQILEIAMQSKDEEDGRTLRQVIQLTFEKATDEAHWASMYAKFCKRMLETMSPDIRDTTIKDKNGNVVSGGALFRKYLLNRCQEEFERGWKPEPKEEEGAEGEEKKAQEAALLSDEYYEAAAAKRRGLGLVQFIGELYKLGMLTERIMHECVRKLVDYQGTPDEAEIESLSKLLRTIGASLDATDKGKPMMDAYFQRIQNIIDLPNLPSRLKFMLMDVVDLRRANWISNEQNKGPKTLDEVRAEAEAAAAAKAAESIRSNQRGGPGGRPQAGRGDARNFSYNQPQPNQVGMDDLRRLKGSASRTASSNMTLGPTSMFSSRSNSGRRLGGPGGALGRAGEESGASSRTGTPPTRESQPASRANAFDILANMDADNNPASPPSTAASPALSKAVPDTAGNKKESD
ncbi:uncharacterized protein E0L32_009564 [Thyridium curvatum]|uniref:MIF4G domain-containing protein n=1 Tax=Thyridium curvatum TaxID=1093900 RepID=A0A507AGQ5_9PEZI|nr:uncharacterized protein E0L32_009564 [Thyridium curvatum]TPX08985.1 hypothetical protein E0L32_009564 [Thyridium curvatum]